MKSDCRMLFPQSKSLKDLGLDRGTRFSCSEIALLGVLVPVQKASYQAVAVM